MPQRDPLGQMLKRLPRSPAHLYAQLPERLNNGVMLRIHLPSPSLRDVTGTGKMCHIIHP